jgi:signal transduction histidine kinase
MLPMLSISRAQLQRRYSLLLSALDWHRIPVLPDEAVVRTEGRLAKMVACTRAATALFLVVPLFSLSRLAHPAIAVAALCCAAAEAAWFVRRVWRRGTVREDSLIAGADVMFCLVLMLGGSRAAAPELRSNLMTELVPFSLVASGVVAFALGLRIRAAAAVLIMAGVWGVSVAPDITAKLGSDVLGFVSWYFISLYIACLLRGMAAQTARLAAERRAADRYAAEQERLVDLGRHRESVRQGLHDSVVAIFDALARDHGIPPAARRLARRGSLKARTLLDTTTGSNSALRDELAELSAAFVDSGLLVSPRLYGALNPPRSVAAIVVAIVNEALSNALKYAGADAEVTLVASGDARRLEVSVQDDGAGFDLERTVRGGGLTRSFPAIEACGGSCSIVSAPGEGTKVLIIWEAADGDEPGNHH